MTESRLVHLLGATGQPRVEQFDGREHLVVPVVALIGDNVIHAVNAPSAEFVPATCLSASGWDGRPLVLGHPTENGRQISANDPAVLERQGFGFLAKTRMAGKRLGTEAWCDVDKLTRLGQVKMLEDLRAGKPIEVSVGAFVQTRDKVGTHNGRQYSAEWATTAPDHLAFLPNSLGACSIEMGCGANRAAMRVMQGSDELEEIGMKSIIDPVTLRFCRDVPQSVRDEMDASDFAGPGTSFPIKTQVDVDAAKHLIGKAANPDAVKKRVIAIAKRKGLTIPAAWRSAENPEGINQYTGGAAHEAAANAHESAAKAYERHAAGHGEKGLAQHFGAVADRATHNAPAHEQAAALSKSAVSSRRDSAKAAEQHHQAAEAHRQAAKTMRGAGEMNAIQKIKARVMAAFKTLDDMGDGTDGGPDPVDLDPTGEEAAELVAYKSLRAMLDGVLSHYGEASKIVDALISDEEDDPTETSDEEDAEEAIEDARLDALRMACYTMSAALNQVCAATYKLQAPDLPATNDARYMEQFKTLLGKSISAKNLKVIQAAHDASHDTHSHTVALGAQCNGMKLLEAAEQGDSFRAAACGCQGEVNMNATERAAALKAIADTKDAKFTEEELKGLQLLSDKSVAGLRDLAAKTPGDAIIQAKYAADAALAGHAHGLNAKDQADKDKADKVEPKGAEEALKAAKAAGFDSVEAQERAAFYAKNPDLKALVDRAAKQEQDRKAELVVALKACGALTVEQLQAKTLQQLEELAAFAKIPTPDFSAGGMRIPRAAEDGEKDVFLNPPDPYAKALEARKKTAVN